MPPPREQPNPPGRNRRRPEAPMPGSWLWLVILLMLVLVLFVTVGVGSGTAIGASELFQIAADGKDKAARKNTLIKRVWFIGEERLEGEFLDTERLPQTIREQLRGGKRFSVLLPVGDVRDGTVTKQLREAYVPYSRQEEHGAWIPQLLMLLLPALILLAIFFFFFLPRFRDPLGGGFLSNYIKSPAKRYEKNKTRTTFEDVADMQSAKSELQEVVDFLKDAQKFQRLGAQVPKGVLLIGPPGTGKTLLARAVAGEAGVPFFSISGSEFIQMFVGVGASVTGDTPILVRTAGRTRMMPIGEFVDGYYPGNQEGFVVPVAGVQTLGFEQMDSSCKGSTKVFVKGSAWSRVRGVYRHRVTEIYEIHYLGGMVRTTGDHSVFIRTRDGIKAVPTRELKPGNVLVNLPTADEQSWRRMLGLPGMPSSPLAHRNQSPNPIVRQIVVKPFDGYVYDLCGCDNEAFFGGEKPVLLHNSRVRDMFKTAKENAPCLLFIDEIDAVGRMRGAGVGGGSDEREQTLNQILSEMDGFQPNESVIVLAATNRPDVLDSALLRPGRFDRHVTIDRPTWQGRLAILKVHTRNKPLGDDVNLEGIARKMIGMTGADLRNLANEAALLATRENKTRIDRSDFERAADRVLMGPKREEVLTPEGKRMTAYHESGHALVAWYEPECDPPQKVSIIPRGRALGVTFSAPEEERYHHGQDYFKARLILLMGGRAADRLVFNQPFSGHENDLKEATRLARYMVTHWGMSDRLGPMSFRIGEEHVFLGKEIQEPRDFSEETATVIDEEVQRLLREADQRAYEMLEGHRPELDRLVEVLLQREEIYREELEEVLGVRKGNANLDGKSSTEGIVLAPGSAK